jgi:AcrR family transcriptional regulator
MDKSHAQDYIPVVMEVATCPAAKGRPREFDTDEALTAALRVFWSKGYEGASLNDLTEAMGITRPSLYAAFGNKEALFRKALDLYEREKLAYMSEAINKPTARQVAEHLLRNALQMQMNSCDPKGCMGVINSVACGVEAESIRASVIERGNIAKRALTERFERARAEGDLPADSDPASLTSYLIAIMQGLAVQAGAGASCRDLTGLIDTSLAMWPSR